VASARCKAAASPCPDLAMNHIVLKWGTCGNELWQQRRTPVGVTTF